MNELDDRLAGDLVWELFPGRSVPPAKESWLPRAASWIAGACLAAAAWPLSPALAILIACVAVSVADFRKARHLVRSIPEKAGGTICARFTYGWGAWKFAMTALAFTFATAYLGQGQSQVPPGFVGSFLLFASGHLISAILTATGLVEAYRYGMRIWVGEGVNQARLLLLAMLLTAFTIGVLGPLGVWLAASAPHARDSGDVTRVSVVVVATLGLIFLGAFVTLGVLDWISQRVVADRPAKFGPKVPAVGKWNS